MQRTLRRALFSATLLLAAYLRITGLAWGINSGYGHEQGFQPDEYVSLRGVRELDLLAGHVEAPGAYFEGTFNYYLWAVPQALLKFDANKDPNSGYSRDINRQLVYVCRLMSVLFDLCTVIIVFFAAREATQHFYSSLLSTLLYAVVPIQVIYAHFMRTHILSNLLCALVIWLSLKLRKSQPWHLLLVLGGISGLGAATRYPVGLIVVIPCLYLLLDGGTTSPNSPLPFSQRARRLLVRNIWLLGLGFGIGLFLGHPMLFFAPSEVTKAITGETLRYASLREFSWSHLLDLSNPWRYVTYVIPFAMYPVLWVLPYTAILYLLFRPRLYTLSAPLLIFSFLYSYLMGKGYFAAYFARIAMLLVPGFCVLLAIAVYDLQQRLLNTRTLTAVLTGVLLLAGAPSVAFDIAYVRAMQRTDARDAARQYLRRSIGNASATIGVLRMATYFYTAMPVARLFGSDKVVVRLQDAGQDADFLLAGFPTEVTQAEIDRTIRMIEAQGKFRYAKTYRVPVRIFGHRFTLTQFPQDMTYPFPTILVFQARTQG
jgi:hypothetical protein